MLTLDDLHDDDDDTSLHLDIPMVAICDHAKTIVGLVDVLTLIGRVDWHKSRDDVHVEIVATAEKIKSIAEGQMVNEKIMPELDPTYAPNGYRARVQTERESSIHTCAGCAFSPVGGLSRYGCSASHCSRSYRPDGRAVVFEKIEEVEP